MPDRPIIPILPSLYICPGIMPNKAFPGLITPAQFGPMSVIFSALEYLLI